MSELCPWVQLGPTWPAHLAGAAALPAKLNIFQHLPREGVEIYHLGGASGQCGYLDTFFIFFDWRSGKDTLGTQKGFDELRIIDAAEWRGIPTVASWWSAGR